MNPHRKLIAGLVVCLIPFTASANAGTPLMWASMLHLVFGNFLIGMGEGVVLASIFRLPRTQTMLIMIAANYFSTWVGDLVIMGKLASSQTLDIYNAWPWFWKMVKLTFVLTCALELPFAWFCLRKAPGSVWKSVCGNLLIQTLSYALIFGWYWGASAKTLYRQFEVVPAAQIPWPSSVMVFFISDADGDVYLLTGNDIQPRRIADLNSTDRNNRLLLLPSSNEPNRWDLIALLEGHQVGQSMIVSNASFQVAQMKEQHIHPGQMGGTRMNFGIPPYLGDPATNDWSFWVGYWAAEGIHGKHRTTGEVYLAWEVPFTAWAVRNATQLADDSVIFQLGESQICLFNPYTKKVSLLAKGRGPAVVQCDLTETIRLWGSTPEN